jgi:tRNA modification GTPase
VTDTIFALATAPGRAALAVIRLSGPEVKRALRALAGRVPAPRRASLRTLRLGEQVLDRGLVLQFPGPDSYTGEDCAELQLHGGQGVIDLVTTALLQLGLRLAEPGEFTRRAFENGKLDLDQAEAVADLTDAESAAQTRQALGQLEGRLGVRYAHWREQLLDILSQLEAAVDFPDEVASAQAVDAARAEMATLSAALDAALNDEARGRRVRDGYRVAVIGAPNSGKSSLVNALLGREAAIVTATPGTTRDVIEAPLVIEGFKLLVADTAGLREATDAIEREGVRRAGAWADGADLRLWVVDQSTGLGGWRQAADRLRAGDLCILNKSDLSPGRDSVDAAREARELKLSLVRSAVTVDEGRPVVEALSLRVRTDLAGRDFPVATRARHEGLLREAGASLKRALGEGNSPELAAEDVRLAARALGRISGRIGAEDVLGRVFASFCIGK